MNASDRLLDLYVARATEGLTEYEERELEKLRHEHPEIDEEAMELAAAAIDVELTMRSADVEEMPDSLKAKLHTLADAQRFVAPVEPPASNTSARVATLGWLAAAAMLILAIWSPWRPTDPTIETPVTTPLTPAMAREAMIRDDSAAIQIAWNKPEIEAYVAVEGDVVWSPAQQTGFMRLKNLPANNPAEGQYQLWIVDPTRDARPVDGGVFDIPAGSGEVIVPIDAKLKVDSPQAFAITYEQPGGVVVSEGPLLIVAPV